VKWNQCLALLALMNLQGNLILAVRTALSAMFQVSGFKFQVSGLLLTEIG
jgi:hypothetical protein